MGVNTTKKINKKDNNLTLNFHIISLFPESFDSYIDKSIIARAIENKFIKVDFYNPKKFAVANKAGITKVDDRPYGGGPGMVIQAEPVIKSIEKILSKKTIVRTKTLIVFLSPSGAQFDTELATKFSKKYTDIIIVCGRYEGIDARIKKVFKMVDVSVGPWVTTGGELPALIMIDVIARQVEGVLGKFESREESRVSSSEVYTRPEVLIYKNKKYKVPKVLLSGNHKEIDKYRQGNIKLE
ncbi:tRNA (guanosine(37)-N1)-methyltransferase TrmD [Arenimonas sp.]|nr:tRNA (guanosine(37)-N1)-methyltransferase TrmD [Candidatus Parcubacteria bacterium]